MYIRDTTFISFFETQGEQFAPQESVIESRTILQQLSNEGLLRSGEFEDDVWYFKRTNGYNMSMSFSDISESLKIITKCWSAQLMVNRFPDTTGTYLVNLKNVLSLTNNFESSKVEEFISHINSMENGMKRYNVYLIRNFLIFSEVENCEVYLNALNEISTYANKNTRALPKFYDVLTFKDILEHFVANWTEKEKLSFYPVVIWWRLTSIIPMRIREFCNLKRNCLEGTLITIERNKMSFLKRNDPQIDRYEISKDLADIILDYVYLSESYGSSETLISFKMYDELVSKGNYEKQLNTEKFNVMNFERLLKIYYKLIVEETYGFTGLERIKPSDTRHFAFCSLMLQGIDPLTIARLGGHTKIESQLHYQRHLDYFVQSKIYQMTRFNVVRFNSSFNVSPMLLEKYEILSVGSIEDYEEVIEMDDGGYCTDPKLMRCESTRSCLTCSKYWISREQLSSRLNELKKFDSEILSSINNRLKTVQRYWKEAYSLIEDENFNPQAKENLKREIRELNGEINDSSILKTLILREKGESDN